MTRPITNSDLARDFAVLQEQVKNNHEATIKQFDAGYNLILEKLKPLERLENDLRSTQETVAKQGKSIAWIRGIGTAAYVLIGSGAAYLGLVRHK